MGLIDYTRNFKERRKTNYGLPKEDYKAPVDLPQRLPEPVLPQWIERGEVVTGLSVKRFLEYCRLLYSSVEST